MTLVYRIFFLPKIFIHLEIVSYSKVVISTYVNYFIKYSKLIGLKSKLFSLPNKKTRVTLFKSPHVYKKSKQSFELILRKVCFRFELKKEYLHFFFKLILNKPKSAKFKVKYCFID